VFSNDISQRKLSQSELERRLVTMGPSQNNNLFKKLSMIHSVTYVGGAFLFLAMFLLTKTGRAVWVPQEISWIWLILAGVSLGWAVIHWLFAFDVIRKGWLAHALLSTTNGHAEFITWFLSVLVFGSGWAGTLVKVIQAGVGEWYVWSVFVVGLLLLIIRVAYVYYSRWRNAREQAAQQRDAPITGSPQP
jgi:hypothetical protein